MNTEGRTHIMPVIPMLPVENSACLVYPTGGVEGHAVDGAIVLVQICRHREATTGEVLGQYMTVLLCRQDSVLSKLCGLLREHAPAHTWIRRQPQDVYRMARESLRGLPLHSLPTEWDDTVLINMANDILSKIPIVVDSRVTAALERQVPIRRAFAGALAGIYKRQRSVVITTPPGPILDRPWHETMDTESSPSYDHVSRFPFPGPHLK